MPPGPPRPPRPTSRVDGGRPTTGETDVPRIARAASRVGPSSHSPVAIRHCTDGPRPRDVTSTREHAVLDVATLRKDVRLVKTMTCKQMGGPCDVAFQGNTADDVIKAEDHHLKTFVKQTARGDYRREGNGETLGAWPDKLRVRRNGQARHRGSLGRGAI